ncbi:response regulator [Methanolobus halotolerans]|uniref:Histidine kinase n=1 Tax=Methanolobus halotolerans TaxID=2052935 RepID=A0A4E0Q2R7_9EURY|nr:response regulator [Methanolobus halotolerans]TGC11509.1 histidine kinase [Methanolobus halotolerans]
MTDEKIMIVEDEKIVALDIKDSLESFGYSVPCMVSTGKDAIEMARIHNPDLILMDVVLKGDMDGIKATEIIHDHCDIPVIYLTAYSDEKTIARAKLTSPFGHILKPFENRELRTNIEIALYKRALEKEKLLENENWINSLLNNIGDAIISTDAQGKVKLVNPLAQALTGYRQEEAFDKPIEEIFRVICEDTGKTVQNPTQKVLNEGAFYGLHDKTVLISRENNHTPIDVIGSPIKNSRNEIMGTIIVFYDISERKDIEKSFLNYSFSGDNIQKTNH